jgi:hypothetical protein
VIRKDEVSRCGPLGASIRRLRPHDQSSAVSCRVICVYDCSIDDTVLREFGEVNQALFCLHNGRSRFPFALRRDTLPIIVEQIENGNSPFKN